MQEARELANDPSTDYTAAPLEDDIFVCTREPLFHIVATDPLTSGD